jgi:hypothetical protein
MATDLPINPRFGPQQGILFDQSTVIERAKSSERWTQGPLQERIAFESGE